MPDDTFEIPEIPGADEDLVAPTETRYYECAECAVKPGSPVLCADCLERRSEFHRTGRTRRPLYRTLNSHSDRISYVRYLRRARDGFDRTEVDAPVTDEDLDREFPDRLEPRLRSERWNRTRGAIAQMHEALAQEPVIVRNSWGIPSIWGPMQTSQIFNTQEDLAHHQRIIERGAGLQPGQLTMLVGRQSGRSWFAAQMALEAAQEGLDVRMIRPQGEPINVTATVSRAAEEGRELRTEDILQELRQVAEQLGIRPREQPVLGLPAPTITGIDYADVSHPDSTVYTTMEMSPDHVYRLAGSRFQSVAAPAAHVRPEEAVVVATLLDSEFERIDVHAEAAAFEEWDRRAVQQVLHNLGIDPARVGMEPLSPEAQATAAREQPVWWSIAETYAAALTPRSTRPGPATGPSRFDREFQVPDEPVYRNVLPPPRFAPPQTQPSTMAYLHRGRGGNESVRSAYEKLFGDPGDFSLPSRYERINWADE